MGSFSALNKLEDAAADCVFVASRTEAEAEFFEVLNEVVEAEPME